MINLLEEIKTSVINLNSSAKVVMLNDANNEAENLNFEGIVIRIKTDFSGDAVNIESGNAVYNEKYNIEFVTLDEFDSSDEESYTIVNEMKTLANSIFNDMFWVRVKQFGNNKVTWSFKPIWRAFNGTMTGISVSLKYSDMSTKICSYV